MKKITRMGFMAAATLLAVACSQEELVDKSAAGKSNGKNVMSFSANVPNMTRAAGTEYNLEEKFLEFGVYAIKTIGTEKTLIMDNYVVKFLSKEDHDANEALGGSTWGGNNDGTLTDSKSYWYYDGIKETDGAKADQYLRYWDVNADRYDFYAYIGYNKVLQHVSNNADATGNVWYHTTDKALNYKLEASKTDEVKEFTNDGYPLLAYAGYPKSFDYKDVSFNFKHINGKVNVRFYTNITAYKVHINSIKINGEKINQKSSVKFTTEGMKVTATNVAALTDLAFTTPTSGATDYLPLAASNTEGVSPTTYYCMPTSTVEGSTNTKLVLTVSYTLSAGGETINKEKTVDIPVTATQWAQNTAYLYTFKIGSNEEHPIVFDGIKITDYDKVEYGDYTIVD